MDKILILDGNPNIDVNIDGESEIVVAVGHETVVHPISIIENGHYEPESGVDGFSSVDVSVQFDGYSLDDIASGNEPSGDLVINSNEIVAYFAIANRKITSIYAPHAKSVGISGFNTCTSLLDVKLPVCEVLYGASFQSCSKLKNIEVPSLIKVSQSAFMSCVALTSIYLPLVESIENQSFRACVNLTELKLPSCSSITGSNVFTSDINLHDVYLPNAESTYAGAPWGAPETCTFHYNTQFDENGEPIIE